MTPLHGILYVAAFLDFVGIAILSPLLPGYVRDAGGTATEVGAVLSVYSIGQLVASPLLGRLSDRIGRRPVVLLSLAGSALTLAYLAWAVAERDLAHIKLARTLAGLCAANIGTLQVIVTDTTEGTMRAKIMGRLSAAMGLGLFGGPLLGAAIAPLGPAAPSLLAAAMSAACCAVAAARLPETRPAHTVIEPAPVAPDFDHDAPENLTPLPFRYMLIHFAVFLAVMAVMTLLPLYGRDVLVWSETRVSLAFALFGLILVAMQAVAVGPVVRRLGMARALRVGILLLAIGLGIAAIGGTVFPLAGLVLVAVGLALCQTLTPSLAAGSASAAGKGASLGAVQAAGSFARGVGPVAEAAIYERAGLAPPFVALALFLAILPVLVREPKLPS